MDLSLEICNAVCQTSMQWTGDLWRELLLSFCSLIYFYNTWWLWYDHFTESTSLIRLSWCVVGVNFIFEFWSSPFLNDVKDRTIIESLLWVHDFHFNSFLKNAVYKWKHSIGNMLTIPVPPKSHKSTIQRTSSSLILHTNRIIKKRNWLQNYDIGV